MFFILAQIDSSDMAYFFGDLSQNEKFSEIKPPLNIELTHIALIQNIVFFLKLVSLTLGFFPSNEHSSLKIMGNIKIKVHTAHLQFGQKKQIFLSITGLTLFHTYPLVCLS